MEELFEQAKAHFLSQLGRAHILDYESIHWMAHKAALETLPEVEDVIWLATNNLFILDVIRDITQVLPSLGLDHTDESKLTACVYWHLYQDLMDLWERMDPRPTIVLVRLRGRSMNIQQPIET